MSADCISWEATVIDLPTNDDPKTQLVFMQNIIQALIPLDIPRLQTIQTRFELLLTHSAEFLTQKPDPGQWQNKFGIELCTLQMALYDLLFIVLNQVRGTIRLKLKQGFVPPPPFRSAEFTK